MIASGTLLRQDNGCPSPFPYSEDVLAHGTSGLGKPWNLTLYSLMVWFILFYTGDASFISDCTVENARDKERHDDAVLWHDRHGRRMMF